MKTAFSPYRALHYSGAAPKNLADFFLNDQRWPRSQRQIVRAPACDWVNIAPKSESLSIESRSKIGDENFSLFNGPAISLFSANKEIPLFSEVDCGKEFNEFNARLQGSFMLGGLDVSISLSLHFQLGSNYKASLNVVVGRKSFSGPPLTLSAELDRFKQHRINIFGHPFLLAGPGQKQLFIDHPPTPAVTIDFLKCTSTGEQTDQFSLLFRDQDSVGGRQIKRTDPFDFVVDDVSFQLDLNKDVDLYRVIAPGIKHQIFSGWPNRAHRIIIGQTLIGCLPHFNGLVSFDFSGI
ncbi:MAG: hypothetical protein PHG97_03715 [Candidatus Margulisbacteria bacterium]|nr:hypothetical protein [Candidatus Margulisiibacteriota bacterium]